MLFIHKNFLLLLLICQLVILNTTNFCLTKKIVYTIAYILNFNFSIISSQISKQKKRIFSLGLDILNTKQKMIFFNRRFYFLANKQFFLNKVFFQNQIYILFLSPKRLICINYNHSAFQRS